MLSEEFSEVGREGLIELDLIDDFDVIECEGEWEALLMESRLIKDIRPRFNSLLLDDEPMILRALMYEGTHPLETVEFFSGEKSLGRTNIDNPEVKWKKPRTGRHVLTVRVLDDEVDPGMQIFLDDTIQKNCR